MDARSFFPDPFRLDGRTALVTGAGGVIGRAICETLAAAGASVVAADIDVDAAQATAESVTSRQGSAVAIGADARSRTDLVAAVDHAVSTFGALHIMCNLGGAPAPFVELCEVTDDDYQSVLAGHLSSVLYGCQAAAPHLVAAGGGAIVNMSSTVIDAPTAGAGLYALAKTGVASITRTLAVELGPRNVRVNAIAPGATLTGFSRRYFTDSEGNVDEDRREAWLAQMASMSPLAMVGAGEDQAWLVLYLVSDAARFVTGQVIRANGGWTMR
jgi:3-oxoacyl-[acyl-carrier protein] reductase